jgi:Mg2+ and Co2+ transporter CorA
MQFELAFPTNFTWIDVLNPSEAGLNEVAQKYKLHSLFIQDCLDPEHLRKALVYDF